MRADPLPPGGQAPGLQGDQARGRRLDPPRHPPSAPNLTRTCSGRRLLWPQRGKEEEGAPRVPIGSPAGPRLRTFVPQGFRATPSATLPSPPLPIQHLLSGLTALTQRSPCLSPGGQREPCTAGQQHTVSMGPSQDQGQACPQAPEHSPPRGPQPARPTEPRLPDHGRTG